MKLLVVVPNDARHRLFSRLLRQPKIQTLLPKVLNGSPTAVKVYRVRRAVPVVHSLIPSNHDLREFWTSRWLDRREPGNALPAHGLDNNTNRDDARLPKGGESW